MLKGHFYSPAACQWQSFYLMFGCSSNAWLNAVVAWQVRAMLWSSQRRLRYFPPTRKTVTIQALVIYIYTAFVASWVLYGLDWLPHKTQAQAGLVCVPVNYDLASTLFFWFAFVPASMGIPLTIVMFVVYDVLHNNLLPPRGKRRTLGVYFFRIAVVFVVMWTPCVLCFWIVSASGPWVVWVSAVWGHLQGFVSTTVSIMKPDVAMAVKELLTCRYAGLVRGRSTVFFGLMGSSQPLRRGRQLRASKQRAQGENESAVASPFGESPAGESEQQFRHSSKPNYSSKSHPQVIDYYDDVPVQSDVTFQFLDEEAEELLGAEENADAEAAENGTSKHDTNLENAPDSKDNDNDNEEASSIEMTS